MAWKIESENGDYFGSICATDFGSNCAIFDSLLPQLVLFCATYRYSCRDAIRIIFRWKYKDVFENSATLKLRNSFVVHIQPTSGLRFVVIFLPRISYGAIIVEPLRGSLPVVFNVM